MAGDRHKLTVRNSKAATTHEHRSLTELVWMREAQQPQEFSVSRLAKRWNLEHGFIAAEIKEGRLFARRIGGRHLRVHYDEVKRYERDHGLVPLGRAPEHGLERQSEGATRQTTTKASMT